MNMADTFIDTAVLERFKVGMIQTISPYLINARTEVEWDTIFESYAVKIRGYLWSEPVQHREIKYPADWWQAFKAHWFPAWAKLRWPVKYTIHVVDIKAVYPEFRPSLPSQYEYRFHLIESTGAE